MTHPIPHRASEWYIPVPTERFVTRIPNRGMIPRLGEALITVGIQTAIGYDRQNAGISCQGTRFTKGMKPRFVKPFHSAVFRSFMYHTQRPMPFCLPL